MAKANPTAGEISEYGVEHGGGGAGFRTEVNKLSGQCFENTGILINQVLLPGYGDGGFVCADLPGPGHDIAIEAIGCMLLCPKVQITGFFGCAGAELYQGAAFESFRNT